MQTKIEDLSADISALNLSLAESDNDKVQLGRQLQEVEKERADLEVKAGRLEQRVAENNALIENLSKVTPVLIILGGGGGGGGAIVREFYYCLYLQFQFH